MVIGWYKMLIGFHIFCCSNENDITEQLKKIIQSNASLEQELSEASSAGKHLVEHEFCPIKSLLELCHSRVKVAPSVLVISVA